MGASKPIREAFQQHVDRSFPQDSDVDFKTVRSALNRSWYAPAWVALGKAGGIDIRAKTMTYATSDEVKHAVMEVMESDEVVNDMSSKRDQIQERARQSKAVSREKRANANVSDGDGDAGLDNDAKKQKRAFASETTRLNRATNNLVGAVTARIDALNQRLLHVRDDVYTLIHGIGDADIHESVRDSIASILSNVLVSSDLTRADAAAIVGEEFCDADEDVSVERVRELVASTWNATEGTTRAGHALLQFIDSARGPDH